MNKLDKVLQDKFTEAEEVKDVELSEAKQYRDRLVDTLDSVVISEDNKVGYGQELYLGSSSLSYKLKETLDRTLNNFDKHYADGLQNKFADNQGNLISESNFRNRPLGMKNAFRLTKISFSKFTILFSEDLHYDVADIDTLAIHITLTKED